MLVTSYFAGLDLGQANDYTALAVLECVDWAAPDPQAQGGTYYQDTIYGVQETQLPMWPATPDRRAPRQNVVYTLNWLERYERDVPYTTVCERVTALYTKPPLTGSVLAIDYTGVGRPVFDMFRKAAPKCTLKPITITTGFQATQQQATGGGVGWHVPKRDLVGAAQVLLQSRRLRIAPRLPLAAILRKELEAFRVKVTSSANETFEAWRERDHDDLVLAVCLAAWVAERGSGQLWVHA